MPASRPSRVGDPSPVNAFPFYDDDILEEIDRVDRKIEQLERARERKKELEPQRQRERLKRKWDDLRRYFPLSCRQELLFRAVDGKKTPCGGVVEAAYGVKWGRLSKKKQSKYLGRLRTLQHSLNQKMIAKSYSLRVTMRRGKMFLIRPKYWKMRRGAQGAGQRAIVRLNRKTDKRSKVARCADFLRSLFVKYQPLLKDGWIPVAMLTEPAERKGYRPSTIKTARKHLRLQCRHVGFGGKGAWEVRLPDQNGAKT